MYGRQVDERQPLLSQYVGSEPGPQFEGPEARVELEGGLLRKLDIRMSILVVIYILNYIDRNSAAAARLRGFEHDLGLEGSQFASILSALYIGYVLMQVPSNMLLNYVGKPSVYLSSCTMIWGAISTWTGFVTSYHGALLARFLLGFSEAAFFPGALLLIAKWYKRSELSQRTAILVCAVPISNAFGPLIASGILDSMDGVLGYTAWRWLFFVEGGLTMLVAVLSLFILPDFPDSKPDWLTPAEYALAQRRINEDSNLSPLNGPKPGYGLNGLVLAFRDWKVWWLAISFALIIFSFSFNLYFPTLCATMGYDPTTTLLLCTPPWLIATTFALWIARRSDRVGDRCIHTVIPLSIGTGGFVMAMLTMNIYVRYLSLFLMAIGNAASIGFLAWASSSVSDIPAKRAVALALINTISQCGGIVGSYVWPSSWGPTYNKSYALCTTARLVCILMLFIFRKALVRLNREMERSSDGGVASGGKRWRYHL